MALKNLNSNTKKTLTIVVIAVAVIGVAWYVYHRYKVNQELKHPKFYSGNGRLEATEVYVSAKLAGRIDNIFVREGDLVRKGDRLVKMETDTLEAQKASIIAQIKVCEGELAQAEAELEQAKADVEKKESSLKFAKYKYDQQKKLLSTNATAEQREKEAETAYANANAELASAKANVKSAEAKIKKQKAEIQKQQAELKKTEVDIADSTLYAHYDGRVQNLLAHEGEVLSAGGRVMNIIALTDVYMTFFLPTNIVGKVKLGAEVKLIFDAAPDYPINAKVTFIDPVAQFTPKSVETQVEREKLMFRVKASIDPKLLEKHLELVKTGLPGVAWVKLDPNASWTECPVKININPPQPPAVKEDLKKAKEAEKAAREKAAAEQKAAEKKAAEKKQPAVKATNTPAEQQK